MAETGLKDTIRAIATEFQVAAVWMFGSALEDEQAATDIDLAVEGLAPERFFDFYGRLFFELPKPVDLVDLSQNPPIAAIIREKGVRIYERRE
ncbi:MAG: hypothetical protein KAY65_04720 [Planctomycetes bacterium]|nr:hypothetical protein [Planctomycetota bacterium]